MLRIISLTFLLWSLTSSITLGQTLERFVETFSGQGDHPSNVASIDGLDHPDWMLSSTFDEGEFEVTPDGLAFRVGAADTTPDGVRFGNIRRSLFGTGSFLETIALRSLDTAHVTKEESSKSISLFHPIHERALLGWQLFSGIQDNQWALVPVGSQEGYFLPIGTRDLDITVEYRADDNVVNTYVDEDPFDAIEAVLVDSRVVDRIAEPDQLTRLTIGASGFEQPVIEGIVHSWSLIPFSNVIGDFDGDATLDVDDLDTLSATIREDGFGDQMDLNDDGEVSFADKRVWVHDLKRTYFGDANLDGEFASSDLVNVFATGEYEDDIEANSTWETGDWDGDADVTSSDLVLAFQDGGYEQGPRVAAGVPEPTALFGLAFGLVWLARRRNV